MRNTKKQNKKDSNKSAFIVQLILGVICGLIIVIIAETGGVSIGSVLGRRLLLASMFAGIVIHIILHELGHLLGGLISGYKFSSFRVFKTLFIKENGKLTVKKYNLAGTAGQCLMTPPENANGKIPYYLCNLGGGIMNLLCSGVFFALYLLFRNSFSFAGNIFAPLIGLGITLGALNLIPLKMSGIANDGYNIITLRKSENARRAFYITLRINESLMQGVRYKDMPAEWLEVPEDFNDPLTVTIAISRFNWLMDTQNYKAAKEYAEKILNEANKMLELHKNELRCELLFFEIIGEQRQEEIERLYTAKLKKYIKASISHLSKCRLMYAYSKLISKDESETNKALKRLNKTFLNYPYKGVFELERELVSLIDRISQGG